MKNPVSWFEIYVEDMERAKDFYQTVFECQLSKLEAGGLEMWVFAFEGESYGASGALVKMPGFKPGGNSTVVYFDVEDCAIPESRVVAAGGSVFKTKFSIGENGFISLVTDTEGYLIGLYSQA